MCFLSILNAIELVLVCVMNDAVICLGGNAACSSSLIEAAETFLSAVGTVVAKSGVYSSAAEFVASDSNYLNEVLVLRTALDYSGLHKSTKAFETDLRAVHAHAPLVSIDIDIVLWNGEIMRPRDAASAYFLAGLKKL